MKVMSVLSIPYMFTAPASFISCPVEGIFESLMAINFEERSLFQVLNLRDPHITKLTHKQKLMSKVASYLNEMSKEKTQSVFRKF